MKRAGLLLFPILLLIAGLVGAQGAGDAARGRKLFVDQGDFDYPSCAHCHATVSVDQEIKKTGHVSIAFPVWNSHYRGAWKNIPADKGPKSSAEAGNFCVKAFQKREALPRQDLADLDAYIKTLSPDQNVKPRKIGYAPKLPENLDAGDPEAGKKKLLVYCDACHGKSDEHFQFELKPGKYKKLKIAMKVRGWVTRKGKPVFKPNAGQMSFWARNRLSDKDLLDIIAYLRKD